MKCQSCLLANVIDVAGKRRFGDESHHLESIFDKNHRALIVIALVIYHSTLLDLIEFCPV